MGEPTTVLLVDDFEPQLNTWERDLRRHGKRVLKATSRCDAIRLARHARPDLAVVDYFLGSDNGLDVTRDLKRHDPSILVIVVSASMSVACAVAAMRAGADDAVAKPLLYRSIFERSERPTASPALTLADIEWEAITSTILECNGNISRAAERLGIYRQSLQRKLRKRGKSNGSWT